MITLYFSGTGNTKYIAELFSRKMGIDCLSIEDDADFAFLMNNHDTIAICYPIYGSRVPLIMREFVATYLAELKGKKIAIFVTQMAFSGDGARALCDLFPIGHIEVIYAEHFRMPNNICNIPLLRRTSDSRTKNCLMRAQSKIDVVCRDIEAGIVKRRGFSPMSRLLGKIQGRPWQGDSRDAFTRENTLEHRAKHGIRIDSDCTLCEICVDACPMQNLWIRNGVVENRGNCTSCYRCINSCPQRAITVLIHKKPTWQYHGFDSE